MADFKFNLTENEIEFLSKCEFKDFDDDQFCILDQFGVLDDHEIDYRDLKNKGIRSSLVKKCIVKNDHDGDNTLLIDRGYWDEILKVIGEKKRGNEEADASETFYRPTHEYEFEHCSSAFTEKHKQFICSMMGDELEVRSFEEAKKLAQKAARDKGTGNWKVLEVKKLKNGNVVSFVPGKAVAQGKVTVKKVIDRVQLLSEEFNVPADYIWSLYDAMPNELYDGIVNILEDMDC